MKAKPTPKYIRYAGCLYVAMDRSRVRSRFDALVQMLLSEARESWGLPLKSRMPKRLWLIYNDLADQMADLVDECMRQEARKNGQPPAEGYAG